MARNEKRLDAFTRAYIEAALWSTNDESDESGGEPLDKNYGIEDIAPETMELIVEDCADFQKRFDGLIIDEPEVRGEHTYGRWEMAGHDFWLTRGGHGAGFWDGDWPKNGDELTKAAKSYGEFELYVGDDGVIYGPPPDQYRNPPDWLKKRHPSLGRSRTNEPRRASHAVHDFNTLPELIDHARKEGATHVVTFGSGATLYFPFETAGGRIKQYEEARLWRERGYWHAPAAGARKVVDQLPQGAQPIGDYLRGSGQRAAESPFRKTQWTDWEILDSIDKGNMLTPEAERRAVKLAQLGFIDTTGTWRLTAKGRQTVHQRTRIAAESRVASGRHWDNGPPSNRHLPRKPKMTDAAVKDLAGELAVETGGSVPKAIPGGHRWSEPNASAYFTNYSPEYGQKVVVLVSIFKDGSSATDFFGDEGMSETSRYENIGNFTYTSTDVPEMVKDINWVRKTVDDYAASWQADQSEVDESRRPTHRPVRRSTRRARPRSRR